MFTFSCRNLKALSYSILSLKMFAVKSYKYSMPSLPGNFFSNSLAISIFLLISFSFLNLLIISSMATSPLGYFSSIIFLYSSDFSLFPILPYQLVNTVSSSSPAGFVFARLFNSSSIILFFSSGLTAVITWKYEFRKDDFICGCLVKSSVINCKAFSLFISISR